MAIRWLIIVFVFCLPLSLHADISHWDTQQVIPGTEGIEPGPDVRLDHRELVCALLSDRDLSGANFEASNLTNDAETARPSQRPSIAGTTTKQAVR